MNAAEAKEILVLYRPGTADSSDPTFAEALRLCEQDSELKHWFNEHCAVYAAVRARFRQINVPEGLKQQILAERKVQSLTISRRTAVLAVVVAVAVLTGLLSLLPPRREDTISKYRTYMTQTTLGYWMDLETNDLARVRDYFARQNTDTGYVVPDGLEKQAKVTGCSAITWQGKPVSLICFHSGRPLAPGEKNDLWLFVTSDSTIFGRSRPTVPSFRKVNPRVTATWSRDGRTYLLVADGDEEFVRKYL